jgi:hypothetical protein
LGLNKMRKSLQVEKWSNSTEEKDEWSKKKQKKQKFSIKINQWLI